MGRGMDGIVPIRVLIDATEFSGAKARAPDRRRGLTHRRNSVGQPAPVRQGDVFRKGRLIVMIGPHGANLVGWIRRPAWETAGSGSRFVAPPFPSEVAGAIMDE
jgi:hypothetical protein